MYWFLSVLGSPPPPRLQSSPGRPLWLSCPASAYLLWASTLFFGAASTGSPAARGFRLLCSAFACVCVPLFRPPSEWVGTLTPKKESKPQNPTTKSGPPVVSKESLFPGHSGAVAPGFTRGLRDTPLPLPLPAPAAPACSCLLLPAGATSSWRWTIPGPMRPAGRTSTGACACTTFRGRV